MEDPVEAARGAFFGAEPFVASPTSPAASAPGGAPHSESAAAPADPGAGPDAGSFDVRIRNANRLGSKAHIPVEQQPDGTWSPPTLTTPQVLPRMIIQPDFLMHWKVQALSGIIGRAEAFTALLALWGHCQNSKTYVFEFTLPMLAEICQYQGNAATLHQAMLDCWLLDALEDGKYEVHGWAEKNASYVSCWANGAKGSTKKPQSATDRPPMGDPPVTHGYTQPINSGTYRTPEGRKEGRNRKKEGRKEGRKEPCLSARRLPLFLESCFRLDRLDACPL
jgi:hypothetical protein